MMKSNARAVVPHHMLKRVCEGYLIDPGGEHRTVLVLRSMLRPFGAAAVLLGDTPGRLYWPRTIPPTAPKNDTATALLLQPTTKSLRWLGPGANGSGLIAGPSLFVPDEFAAGVRMPCIAITSGLSPDELTELADAALGPDCWTVAIGADGEHLVLPSSYSTEAEFSAALVWAKMACA